MGVQRSDHVPTSTVERLLDVLAIIGLVATWGLVLWYWPQLPGQVPSHFNLVGVPDAYDSPRTLLMVMAVQLGLSLLFTWHVRRWQPDSATDKRVARATRVAYRALNANIVWLFTVTIYGAVMISLGRWEKIPSWWLPVGALLMPVTIIAGGWLYGYAGKRANRQEGGLPEKGGEADRPQSSAIWGLVFLGILLSALVVGVLGMYKAGLTTGQAVALTSGIAMAGGGLVMPHLPRNFFMGIRVPWTLASEHVWRHTHRLSVFIWTPAGLVLIGLALLNWKPLLAEFLVVGLSAAASTLAAYLIWRRTAAG